MSFWLTWVQVGYLLLLHVCNDICTGMACTTKLFGEFCYWLEVFFELKPAGFSSYSHFWSCDKRVDSRLLAFVACLLLQSKATQLTGVISGGASTVQFWLPIHVLLPLVSCRLGTLKSCQLPIVWLKFRRIKQLTYFIPVVSNKHTIVVPGLRSTHCTCATHLFFPAWLG